MNVAGHSKKSPPFLTALKANWAPIICIKIKSKGWFYEHLKPNGWEEVVERDLPKRTIFSKVALLIPAEDCSFKTCYFPHHLVAENELEEAIELDIKQWSIWNEYDCFFTHQLLGEQWQVKIWVWSQEIVSKISLDTHIVTHVIPEPAWYAACLVGAEFSLLIHPKERQSHYALVTPSGWVEKIAQIKNHSQAQRYWQSWGFTSVEKCWLTSNDEQELWSPEGASHQIIDQAAIPHAQLFKKTRLPSVQDWTDPISYRVFFGVALLTYFIWMVSDAGVLLYQQKNVKQQLSVVHQSANDVLELRQKVTERQMIFSQMQGLRYQQQLPEYLISQLTQKIPEDIWLTHLQLEEGELEIKGRGQQVARLLPLLEQITHIEQVMFLSTITPNAKTGEESFQIRLILARIP